MKNLIELIKKPYVTFADLEQIDANGLELEITEYEYFGVHLKTKEGVFYRVKCYQDKRYNNVYEISARGNLNFDQDLIVKNGNLESMTVKNMHAAIFLYIYKVDKLIKTC